MNCVILQPSYIPWRGYFHQIIKSDVFVFLDDVQFDKRGWRNRNKIKTANGLKWLTIPVHSKGAQVKNIPINQIPISYEQTWMEDHLKSIYYAYAKTPFFNPFYELLYTYFSTKPNLLADFTIQLTIEISDFLGISGKKFIRSSTLETEGTKTEKLINILQNIGANHYISGPSAQAYIDEQQFIKNNISVEYMMYDYLEYPQLFPPFESNVSIIDLIFMTGEDALNYIV